MKNVWLLYKVCGYIIGSIRFFLCCWLRRWSQVANFIKAVEKAEIADVEISPDNTKLIVTPKKFGSTKITLASGTGENAVSFDFTLNAVSGVAGKAATAAADGSLKGTIKIKEGNVVIRIFTNIDIATKPAPPAPTPEI